MAIFASALHFLQHAAPDKTYVQDDERLRDALRFEDLEGGVSSGENTQRGLRPIPEDSQRVSSDVRNSSAGPINGEVTALMHAL